MLTKEVADTAFDMADTINTITTKKERIILERQGRKVAAIISIEDLVLLERIEDYIDVREAETLLADPMEEPIPYEDVRKELGFL